MARRQRGTRLRPLPTSERAAPIVAAVLLLAVGLAGFLMTLGYAPSQSARSFHRFLLGGEAGSDAPEATATGAAQSLGTPPPGLDPLATNQPEPTATEETAVLAASDSGLDEVVEPTATPTEPPPTSTPTATATPTETPTSTPTPTPTPTDTPAPEPTPSSPHGGGGSVLIFDDATPTEEAPTEEEGSRDPSGDERGAVPVVGGQ